MSDSRLPSASAASPALSNIDISTPAVVEWGPGNILSDVTFDARRLESTSHAFFKIRCTITLKASAPTKTSLFVFIHPERIQALHIDGSETGDAGDATSTEAAQRKLGTDVFCLRFTLTEPGVLVGPKTSDLTPKNQASGVVLDSMRSLATQVGFAVYIPRNIMAQAQARLDALCKEASGCGLKSIVLEADLTRLYRGKGGAVLNEPDAVDDASTASWHSPPSYGEVGPGPPVPPIDEPAGMSRRLLLGYRNMCLVSTSNISNSRIL